MPPADDILQSKLNEIQSEMKRINLWQSTPPAPGQLQFTRAFGGDKLSFDQWLQFVFLPRVQQIITSGKRNYPHQSQVGDQAFREWKMWGDLPDSENLIQLLKQFDAFFT